ncbi:MAG: hypothetical protein PHI99_01530, partial [Syntrophales bacterium]|nr:hypothetical protein [Syntrophales bacterium]
KNQRRYAPTGGGGINRICMALSIGTPWRIPSESDGGISGIRTKSAQNRKKADKPKSHNFNSLQ